MTYQVKILIGLVYFIIAINTLCFSQTKQFQHITSKDGISQSEVYSFLEDSHGYLWFGTVDGLNRYDGYNIKTFHTDKNNPNSITNNTIRCLAEDQLGRIWIGTDDGLSVYDSELEEIYQINSSEFDDRLLTVNAILIKGDQLFLGTSMGLLLFKIDKKNLKEIGGDVQSIKLSEDETNQNVVSIELIEDGNVWLTTSSGLHLLDCKKNSESPVPNEISELKNRFTDLRDLKQDSYGNLWIVSHDFGFLRFNPITKKLNHFKINPLNKSIISNKISAIALDRDGDLWIGTHEKGLMYLEREYLNDEAPNFQVIQNDPLDDRSLNSNLIYSLYVSKSNLLWIGTIASGINIYDPHRKPFDYYNVQSPANQTLHSTNFVRAVYVDRSGNIWIGMHNNGLFILDRENDKIRKIGFGSESIFHINEASDGNIIVCSGQGVSLVKRNNDQLEMLSTLNTGPTFYASNGWENVFWLAGYFGLKKCKLINQQIIVDQEYRTDSKPAISFDNCRVLFFCEKTNELLVGTEGGGLNQLQLDENHNPISNNIYKKNDSSNSISNNYIRSIIKDADANVWIGTYEGLNKMYTDAASGNVIFKTYTKENGLPNNTIQSIIEDNQKRLWIGTNGGLSKFNPSTERFTHYTINDGIQSNEFSEHAIFKKPDNEIIIGGINGINTFYPNKITSSEFKPNTTVTDFYLFNKKVGVDQKDINGQAVPLERSIDLTDSIFLAPKQNSLGFEFSAMIYNAPEKIRYAYMLDGFDPEWNYTDAKNRRANYTNLGYGDYIFKVKATNNDGLWEEEPQRIFLNIKTPFYYTTFAYVMYVLMSLLAIVFFTNYTAIRSTTKKKILLENQHNKKVRQLEEFRTRFFINISHDLRTPLTLIGSPLEIAMQDEELKPEVKNYLDIVQRNANKLKDMIEELLEARKLEITKPSPKPQNLDVVSFIRKESSLFEHSVKDKGMQLNIACEEESMNISFDPSMISKVMFNMLSNALKHTDEGEINISIANVSNQKVEALKQSKHTDFVEIKIQDSGKGIEEADLEMIFERFYQGKEESSKGYGIGLSHTRDLIEAHEGTIEVESKKGVGTTFSIYIPNQKNPQHITEELPPVLDTQEIKKEASEPVPEVVKEILPAATAKKILLVEDNMDLRNFIGNELGKVYQIVTAVDGKNGLEMASEHFPDLIVSDIMMPKMNGIDFCKEIKSNIKTSHIPVILLTAKVNKASKYEGLEIGADDYITKPFEIEHLLLRIKNLLENRERLRKMFKVSASLEPTAVTVTSLDEKFLSTLMTEIEKGIPDSDFTITALEKELGMSHSSFYNKIKSLTGQSAKELVSNMRIKRARQILEDTTNIRISEVAFMVGFSDPKYFSKCFKEYYGKSPSDFSRK